MRFYIVPEVIDSRGVRNAKYFDQLPIPSFLKDYGLEATFLVGADVTSDQHISLASNLDVFSFPQDLDSQVSLTALSLLLDRVEGLRVPLDWVTTGHTYRQVIAAVGRLFLFMQRFHSLYNRRFFEPGVTLNTRMNELTQAQRAALQDTATSLELNTSVIANTAMTRSALKILLDQMPSFFLAGEMF